MDLLSVLPAPDGLDLWAWVSSRGILDLATLESAVAARRNWHGRPLLGRLLSTVSGGAVSGAEFLLHSLLRKAGVTGWAAGVTVTYAQGVIGIVDWLFARARRVIEVDGFRAHSSPASFVADRRRQNRLMVAGYTVLRFTWSDLQTRPTEVIQEIRFFLRPV